MNRYSWEVLLQQSLRKRLNLAELNGTPARPQGGQREASITATQIHMNHLLAPYSLPIAARYASRAKRAVCSRLVGRFTATTTGLTFGARFAA